jgi:hypothetical protein
MPYTREQMQQLVRAAGRSAHPLANSLPEAGDWPRGAQIKAGTAMTFSLAEVDAARRRVFGA